MEKPRKGETSISARHDWLYKGAKNSYEIVYEMSY